MNNFKKLLLVASLAVAGIASVHAAPVSTEEDTTFLLVNDNAGTQGDATGSYDIDNTGLDINSVTVQQRVVGDTFIDDFLLQVFDAQDVTLYFTSLSKSVQGVVIPDVTFSSIALYDFTGGFYGEYAPVGGFYTFNGSFGSLTSGLYDFEIEGTINVTGGEYVGTLGTVPTIPEPTSWALMLAGLGAMGVLARRRKQG
jgi:hypothetical protein